MIFPSINTIIHLHQEASCCDRMFSFPMQMHLTMVAYIMDRNGSLRFHIFSTFFYFFNNIIIPVFGTALSRVIPTPAFIL